MTCPQCRERPAVPRSRATPSGHIFTSYACNACQFAVDYQLCLDTRKTCRCADD